MRAIQTEDLTRRYRDGTGVHALALVAAVACFLLRFLAIRRGWNLPTAQPPSGPDHG